MLSKIFSTHRDDISRKSQEVDRRHPMFGPLDIKNHKEFLKEGKEFYRQWSKTPFPYKLNLNNFQPLYDLGMGAFGKVILVKYKLFEKSYYAMKILSKKKIVDANIGKYVLSEKNVLQGLNCPFCIRLEYFTSDDANLYYLLSFISGGELIGFIEKDGNIAENIAKFYAGQIVLALEFMHYCGLVHRDLKPENILIDHFGYIKVADFGFTVELKDKASRAYTFCGTPEYIAPEVILGTPYFFPADWWSMGVVTYEMVFGKTPFEDKDAIKSYEKTVEADYEMPSKFSSDLKDFVDRLLQRDVTKRMGNLKRGVEEIKQHVWFKEIAWLPLLNRRVIPPYIPTILGDFDTANFPHLKKLPPKFSITSVTHGNTDDYGDIFVDF